MSIREDIEEAGGLVEDNLRAPIRRLNTYAFLLPLSKIGRELTSLWYSVHSDRC